jgi:hypothetical protein
MQNNKIEPGWISNLDQARRERTIELMMDSAKDEGMLGFEEADELKVKEFVADLAAKLNGNGCWLLQADAGNDLAYSVVMERWVNPTGAHIAELKKAVVNHKYRGGRLVMQGFSEILKKAKIEGIDQFVIDVREGTRAEKLWRSIGFREYVRISDEGDRPFRDRDRRFRQRDRPFRERDRTDRTVGLALRMTSTTRVMLAGFGRRDDARAPDEHAHDQGRFTT